MPLAKITWGQKVRVKHTVNSCCRDITWKSLPNEHKSEYEDGHYKSEVSSETESSIDIQTKNHLLQIQTYLLA